jgi:LytS/YehU family sensor histidine kinase
MLLQPHFLFNSLNNLYALSLKQSDLTSDAIAGLSELLEKVVAYSQKEYISLKEEIDLIKQYIKLERIWLGETSFLLDLCVSGDIEEIKLPPLVLYTFVENCFKHGVRKCDNSGWISIKIDVRKHQLHFATRNLLPELNESGKQEGSVRDGFGVVAAKELLESKCCGRFHLTTSHSENIYGVDLNIDASE